jgi:hypothetical protein
MVVVIVVIVIVIVVVLASPKRLGCAFNVGIAERRLLVGQGHLLHGGINGRRACVSQREADG